MSIHSKLSPEAQAKLHAQRRNSTITSAVISLLTIALIALILGIFFIPNFVKETPTIVTYAGSSLDKNTPEKKKINTAVQRKPSAPSSTAVKAIASKAPSNVSIPVFDVPTTVETVEFGDGESFGTGWGDGSGFGDGGGGASFFNQSVRAERIAYVIDYSISMTGERERLMREELAKSVESLKTGTQFQMIFFSGPAWVAGSELPGYNYMTNKATVKGKGGKSYEWTGAGLFDWTPKGKRQPVDWIEFTTSTKADSLRIIKESPLSGGTDWENPLLMAFDMEPSPELIFFMTDGEVKGRDMMALVKDLASIANRKGIIVNTIAMMEPKAEQAMADLAKRTGGQFTIVGKDGKARPGKNK